MRISYWSSDVCSSDLIDAGDALSLVATTASGGALPSWLTFDALTRTFSGVPTNNDVGLQAIKVTATDKAGATTSDIFNLTVANANDAPQLVNAVADLSIQRSEEHTSELQSLMRISYAVFCLKQQHNQTKH